MKLYDVYPLFDINIVKGKGCHVWDEKGDEYLDLYGGHAVISIGHAHPHYVEMISNQVAHNEDEHDRWKSRHDHHKDQGIHHLFHPTRGNLFP